MRSYLDILTEAPARGLSNTGGLVNFNVDKSLPVTKIKDSEGNTFDLHASEEDAQKFIDSSNAYEKFDASTAAPQAGGNKELDAIVAKYAKSGMSLDDVAKMEQEAGSDSNARYVLAYAAKTLGVEGMYRADGSGFIYLKDGQPSGARGASLGQSQDLAKLKLLPQPIVDKMQKVADSKKEGDPSKEKFQQAVNDQTGEDPKAMDGEGGAAGAVAEKLKRVQELLAKAIEQAPAEESWAPRSYADQLLEEISAQETTELQGLIKELETELPNIADESIKQQIEAALNQYKEFQAKSTQGIDEPGAEGEVQIDTDSDSAIAAAIKDPALWITNEMPKELAQAQAKGLLKATENGKKKSASAAAVQQIMKQIASITGNTDMDIDADGLYGPASVAAVKKAQELAGITVDGDPGADTAAELVKFSKDPTGKGGIADTDLTQDLDGAIELLKKGIAAFGSGETPTAQAGGDDPTGNTAGRVGSTDPKKAVPPGQPITTSIDFSMRNMLETLETIQRLDEKLSPEDEEALKVIIGELQPKLDDPEYQASLEPEMQAKFTELSKLRAEYNKLVSAQPKAQAGGDPAAITGKLLKAVKGMGTDEEAVYAAVAEIADKAMFDGMLTKNPELIPTVLDDFSGPELQKVIDGFAAKGIKIEVVKEPKGLTSGTYKYDGKTYGVGAGKEDPKAQAGADPSKLANPTGNPEQNPTTPTAPPPRPAAVGQQAAAKAPPTQQQLDKRKNTMAFQSKDYSMKKAINESASMNISMSGDNASEVGELLKILKNAGMPDAAPVGAMDMPMDTPMPVSSMGGDSKMDIDMDGDHQPDIAVKPTTHDHDMPDETPCGGGDDKDSIMKLAGLKGPMPEDDVEEDGWDNSPDEEYKDDNTMYQSGGLAKPKKAYPAAQDGDNPMAVESVKERLWAALQEKTAKASRGNEDIKTTEGRGKGRGKKKSRG